jgi:hypothetical protein
LLNDKKKTSEIDIIVKFAQGDITPKEFEQELYSNANLEAALKEPTLNWAGTYIAKIAANLYDYLICLNYSKIEDQRDAIGALELFLDAKAIARAKTRNHQDRLDLVLSNQPKYIDADSRFIEEYIIPKDFKGSKTELKQTIRDNYNKLFRFQNKPPKWIQNPEWIIKDDKPLFFIGQLEITDKRFHDNGAIYVFIDIQTREISTITQFY